MSNPRLTPKDLGLIKGAIRRVFSRSELRRSILSTIKVDHYDEKRKRVKTWYKCPLCNSFCAGHEIQIDHIEPIVKLHESLAEVDCNTLIDRTWCDKSNLQPICLTCHKKKSKLENVERRRIKKGLVNESGLQHKKKTKKAFKNAEREGRSKRSTSYKSTKKGE